MNRPILVLILLLMAVSGRAQYTAQGRIEFERKTNMHRQMEDYSDGENEWVERYKSQMPKFSVSYFNLSFNTQKSMYHAGRESENATKGFGGSPVSENTVLTDFTAHKVTAQKQIYEQKFLVEDSIRRIQWKITDEIRTIANYKCRKAVGKICDSVYVVAFYTDDILVSGGPEMFAGLPGMILELAVPRLYTTWIATKVEIDAPAEKDLQLTAAKGKKVTQKEMFTMLQAGLKDWGKYAQRNLWWSAL